MTKIISSFFLSSSLLLASQITDNFDIRGFGSIGVSYNDNENMLYRSDIISDSGSSSQASLSPLTNFGIQLDYSLNDKWSATIQGYWNNRIDGYYSTEWANLKYSLNNGDFFRFGKMRLPLYMYSDILNVSYAYSWVHLPNEVYSSMVSNFTGVEYTKNFLFDGSDLSLNFLAGESNDKQTLMFNDDFDVSFVLKNLKGITVNHNYENLRLRASHFVGEIYINQDKIKLIDQKFFQNPLYFPDSGTYLSEKYVIKDDKVQFSGVGFEYDDDFILSSEFTQLKISNNVYLQKVKAWYLNAGYRFGKLQPFVIYGKSEKIKGSVSENFTNPSEQYVYYTPGLIDTNAPSIYDLFQVYNQKINIAQKSLSIGAKYNFNGNIVLKTQIEKIFINETSESIHLNLNNSTNSDMTVYHFSVNFTF